MASVVTYFVFRTGLGAICLLAGLEKARAPRDFFEGVRQYRLVPARFAPVVGGVLVAVELGLGLLLISGLVPILAAIGAIALFAVFAAALAVSLARSNRAPCHCFGASDVETISPVALIRALALTGIAVSVLVYARSDTAVDRPRRPRSGTPDDGRPRGCDAAVRAHPARVVVPALRGDLLPDANSPRELPAPAARPFRSIRGRKSSERRLASVLHRALAPRARARVPAGGSAAPARPSPAAAGRRPGRADHGHGPRARDARAGLPRRRLREPRARHALLAASPSRG